MKNRWAQDPFLKNVYDDEDVSECFRNHEILLNAIFERRGINKNNTYTELEKHVLVQVLKEANIIRAPEKKKVDTEKKEEKKTGKKAAPKEEAKDKEEKKEEQVVPPEQLFQEADAVAAIEPSCSFEFDMLNYFDFLECLVRVAMAYKFKPEEEA